MADNTAVGRLRTTHTVTAIAPISGVFNITNPEVVRIGSSFSTAGDGSENSLYVNVDNKHLSYAGTQYHIYLNWGITVAVGDTVYFDFDNYGLKVAKKNANVNTVGPKDLIFDSRLRRRGTLYSQGFASTMGTSGVDFKGNKTELAYVPLVLIDEDRKGSIDIEDGGFGEGETYTYDYSGYRSNFQVTKSTIKPINAFSWYYDDFTSYTFGRGTSPNNSVANCSFKVLRIPCAYGYMTDAYFKNPHTTNTSRGTMPGSGTREERGKKRLLAGKLTNSNLGYSNLRGMFVSRVGTDIDTCTPDDILMTVDDGKANTAFRGEEQASAINYSTAVANTQVVPTASISQSINTALANTFSISVFNPYVASIVPTAAAPTTAGGTASTGGGGGGTGALSINTSLSTSGFTETITYTLSATTGTFSLSSNIRQAIITPGIF